MSDTVPDPVAVSSVLGKAVACDSDEAALPEGWVRSAADAGLTKCLSPFGIIIGVADDVPDSYIEMVGKIVAELVDPDMDGVANDPAVLEEMANGREMYGCPCPQSRTRG